MEEVKIFGRDDVSYKNRIFSGETQSRTKIAYLVRKMASFVYDGINLPRLTQPFDYPSISDTGKAVVISISEILSTIHPNYYLFALVIVWVVSFVYIKIRYPFWNTQPVVHTYDYMRRFLTREAHIIQKLPYKSRFHDKENKVSTTEYSRVSTPEKTQIAFFLQSHYIPTDRLLSTFSVAVLDAYLSGGSSFISVFRENPPDGPRKFTVDSGPITGVIASRPIHVYLGPTHIEAYFTDFMCVHRESRRVAECLFQTHQFATFNGLRKYSSFVQDGVSPENLDYTLPKITRKQLPISVFRKEGALCEGVVPFLSYTTYTYYMPKTSSKKKSPLPSGFTISRVGKHNITLVQDIYHLIQSENQAMFSTCILPDIGTMLGLLEKRELYLLSLKKGDQLYGIYIFRNAHIHYEELDGETLELMATIQNTENTPLFVSGFGEALREMIQGFTTSGGLRKSAIFGRDAVSYENQGFSGDTKTRAKMLRIPSIGHNQVILSNFQGYLMATPTALYLYNYALPKMPVDSGKCFVVV